MNRTKIYLPEYGYCQGMGVLVSYLLLIMEEEYVFYCCLFILNKLPDNYFSPDLKGLRAEQGVLRGLVKQKLPRLHQFLANRHVDLSFFSVQWLVTLFAGVLPSKMLFTVWDRLLVDGIAPIHSVALSILRYFEPEMINLPDTSDVFKFLADLPIRIRGDIEIRKLSDLGPLINISEETLNATRKKEVSIIKSESVQGQDQGQTQVQLQKEDIVHQPTSYVDLEPHLKQAEVVYSMRHAVDGICRHFGTDINALLDYESLPVSLSDADNNTGPNNNSNQEKRDVIYGLAKTKHISNTPGIGKQLEFESGDLIVVLESKHNRGEWFGRIGNNEGWFPAVKVIKLKCKYDPKGDIHRNIDLSRLIHDLLLRKLIKNCHLHSELGIHGPSSTRNYRFKTERLSLGPRIPCLNRINSFV